MAGKPVAQYQHPRRHHRSPRHAGALPVLTGMLTAVTVIALLSLGSLFVATPSLVAEDRPRDLVRRFYAATNAVLAGGSAAGLEDVMAADLIAHRSGMPSGDGTALVRHLTDLRLAVPGVHLRVSAIVEDEEWAAARVTPLGLRPTVHGVPLELAPEPLEQTEFFRIVESRIVAYWPATLATTVPRALPPLAVAPWVTDTAVALARLAFPPGATLRDLEASGEHLLLVESGELSIDFVGAVSRLDAARPEAGWQAMPASGQELVLQAGDAVLVPPGTRHTLTNERVGSATILGVAMIPVAALEALEHRDSAEAPRLIAIYDPERVGTVATWDRHVRGTVLAAGVGEARSGPCAAVAQTQVSMTRFVLGPGEELPAHPVTGIELLALDAGGLEVGAPSLGSFSTPALVTAGGQGRQTGQRSEPRLIPASSSAPPVRNTGQHPLSFIAVALEQTGGASCAVAPSDT